MEDFLRQLLTSLTDYSRLEECLDLADDMPEMEDAEVRTFADAGLLTRNHGVILHLKNGAEFQISVIQR